VSKASEVDFENARGVRPFLKGQWQAYCAVKGRREFRGPFDTAEEAFYARREIHSALREGRDVMSTMDMKVQMAELSVGQVVSEVRQRGGDRRSRAFSAGRPA
jgi:hypothetical protein